MLEKTFLITAVPRLPPVASKTVIVSPTKNGVAVTIPRVVVFTSTLT